MCVVVGGGVGVAFCCMNLLVSGVLEFGILGWCDTYNSTAYKDSWLKMRRVGFEFGL